MRDRIINALDNPAELEKLYRADKQLFRREFNSIYHEIDQNIAARVWHERLNTSRESISFGTNRELLFVVIISFLAGLIAKIPQFTSINPEHFYQRNIGFIIFPILSIYFAWKHKIPAKQLIIATLAILFPLVFINAFPEVKNSDTLILSCIHLPLLLWSVLGYVFCGNELRNNQLRLEYLRFNGDLLVMTAVLFIAGALLTGITIGLFHLIGISIEDFYFRYVGIWGLAAVPVFATYIVRTNPHLVNRVSPVIAKVFTPLVLLMLIIYLGAVIITGKDPYNDREFLLIFNLLLIGVMAIILFSISETPKNSGVKMGIFMLMALSIVTIIINGIALSAILFRINEWGITPNRLAVLGSNLLILANLLQVGYRLFRSAKNNMEITSVENSITYFLPVYTLWTIVVIFLFPLLFNFS